MVYLKIEHDVALRRILKRKKHFMPPSLLESQIKILEEPKKALEIGIENAVVGNKIFDISTILLIIHQIIDILFQSWGVDYL